MNDGGISQSFTSEAGVATALEDAPRRRIGLTTRILLSLSVGCLSTGLLCALSLLTFAKQSGNNMAWKGLYAVIIYLWTPAYYCASLFHTTEFEQAIWLTVIFNVIIYSLVVFVGSSLLTKWIRR
jgi:hypothetical protein